MSPEREFSIRLGATKSPAPELRLTLLTMGFSSVIAQIVLMRELMVVFYGNEVSLGITLGCWFFWTALGSGITGGVAARLANPRRLLAGLQALAALALPLTLFAIRATREMLHALPGELLGPRAMLISSFTALSLFCFLSGGMFAAGSRTLTAESTGTGAAATSRTYFYDAVGSAAGGILASLLLILVLNSSQILLALSFLNLLSAALLVLRHNRQRIYAAGFFLVAAALLLPALALRLEAVTLRLLWQDMQVVASQNSRHGNLAVVRAGGALSLYENGLPVYTPADPAAAEESVHYALLEHPHPVVALLIGGGLNGSALEALRHPSVTRVDVLESDPAIFRLCRQYFPEQWNSVARSPQIHLHLVDGRLFLKTSRELYDVIILNEPDPQTAQLNRYYTEDFFSEVSRHLASGGIFSFQVTAAENYISPELAEFLRCLNRTLREIFPHVFAVPGDKVIFFASQTPLVRNPQELVARLRARKLHTVYVREYFLPFRMSPDRLADLEQQIVPQAQTPVNHDFAPVAYYYDFILWGTRFRSNANTAFRALAQIRFVPLLSVVLGLGAGLILISVWLRRGSKFSPAQPLRPLACLSTAAMGFTLMGLQILLLLGFQALYGYIYQQLAILVAAFMLGISAGSWQFVRTHAGVQNDPFRGEVRALLVLQIVAAFASPLLCGLFMIFARANSVWGLWLISYGFFPALALLAGALGGFQFALASRIYFGGKMSVRGSTGMLYALDLLGACLAAVALSIWLLPVLGFVKAAWIMGAANLAPAGLAALAAWGRPACPD
jgi:spermidine synthase